MFDYIERLAEQYAEWYLQRRGRFVLPKFFVGLVVVDGTAVQQNMCQWDVGIPSWGDVIGVHSLIVPLPSGPDDPRNPPTEGTKQ